MILGISQERPPARPRPRRRARGSSSHPLLFREAERSAPPRESAPRRERFRTIWISDIHLGTRACRAEALLDFLRATESEFLYLVGDVVDGWQLRRRWYWADSHTEVLRVLLDKVRRGTRVIYVPGNHDEAFRGHAPLVLAGIEMRGEVVHRTADDRRLLVLHGDEFDTVVRNHRWLAHLGDVAYSGALFANRVLNAVRRRLGYPYWSLAGYLKARVKDAVAYADEFEKAVVRTARERKVDGVVCGHIHKAALCTIDGVLYANDGDWVESCTALVEHGCGALELLRWCPEGRTGAPRTDERLALAAR